MKTERAFHGTLSGMLLSLELALLFSVRQAGSAIQLAGFPELLDVYTP